MRVIGLIVAMMLCIRCQLRDTIAISDVNPLHVHGHYAVDYQAEKEEIRFFVQFRLKGKAGTTIQLLSPNAIRVDGEPLVERHTPHVGTYYELKRSEKTPRDSYTFSWKVSSREEFENEVPLSSTLNILNPSSGHLQSKHEDLRVVFTGESPRNGDSVIARLEALISPQPGEERALLVRCEGGNEIIFGKDKLKRFVRGPAVLYLERERQGQPHQGHREAGGIFRSSYQTRHISIEIH